jgi:hypothetical protein
MRTRIIAEVAVSLAATAGILSVIALKAAPTNYHIARRIHFDSGGVGYLAVDVRHRRLLGAAHFIVDVDRDTVVGRLPLHSGYGFALAPDLGVAISRVGAIVDLRTDTVVQHIDVEGHSVTYDPTTGRAFLFGSGTDEEPATTTAKIVDLKSRSFVGLIRLYGEPTASVADGNGHVFANLVTNDSLVVIDAARAEVVSRWPLGDCGSHRRWR